MRDSPWILAQSWNWLLFAHWRVDARTVRPRVPNAFDVDVRDGCAWVAIVASHVTNVVARGLPRLPFVSNFVELNFGTLVSANGRPGVYFFSVDAGSAIAAAAGRTFFNLPYHAAEISARRTADAIEYDGHRLDGSAAFSVRGRPAAAERGASAGSLAFFLMERFSLYNLDSAGEAYRIDIRRRPWALRAAEGTLAIEGVLSPDCRMLPRSAPLLHFVEREDMIASPPQRVAVPLHRANFR